ncbi:MAG TPA: GAF and ANTAR domain-containing protein [Acidimicrobiia bacterium]|nr:GAF and ANTAR domain-containing protein [Acidimicrobiia bacterium]
MTREDLIADTFVGIVDSLVDDFDIIDMLTGLAQGCVDLGLATASGILLADQDAKLRVMAASSERAHLLELFQLQNDEGPCLEAFSTGEPVVHLDLPSAGDRWPRFAPEAVRTGFRSVHAFPLRLRTSVIGAMNLFSGEPRDIGVAATHLAQALADVASIAILQDQMVRQSDLRAGQLQHALDSRVAIEQAKGMIAERANADMEEAFAILRQYARSSRRHLTEVAMHLVEGTMAVDEVAGGMPSPHDRSRRP